MFWPQEFWPKQATICPILQTRGNLQHGPEWHQETTNLRVKKRSKTRRGNPHLRKLLVQAAGNATKKRGSFYWSKYNKLKFRLGSANKAKVAIANRLARVIFKVIGGENYKDLGYMRGNPNEEKIKGLVMQLKNLGVDIKHINHELIYSARKVKVNRDTGEIVEELVTGRV